MDAGERGLFADSARQAFARHADGDVDAALVEIDWQAALVDDPAAATRVVFGLLGELNLASSAIGAVVKHALGLNPTDDRAVVLPTLGGHLPPATYDRAELTVSGLATAGLGRATRALVAIDGGKQDFVTTISTDALDITPVVGIDPNGGWHAVQGQVKVSELKAIQWDDVITAGQLALAQQLTSAARAMLGLAREHAVSRTQFDRPIGSFQAVRHKLAESLVAVESAEAALDAGWADPTPFAATMAKAIAGNAAKTVARHAQQVLAGMGFTSEHAFHRYMKRTMVLDQLLGSSTLLRNEVGRTIIASKQLPPLLPL